MSNSVENLDQILNSISKFYGDAWLSLVTVLATIIGASVAIVGVIIPLIIAYLQRRQQSNQFAAMLMEKDKEIHDKIEDLKKSINSDNEKLQQMLKETLDSAYSEKEKYLLEKIENVKISSEGAIYHVQGIIYSFNERDIDSILSYISASKAYLKSDNEYNLATVCSNIKNMATPLKAADLQSRKGKQVTIELLNLIDDLKNKTKAGSIKKLGNDIEDAFFFIKNT
ncbi:hypothetical protein LEP1GSC034_4171 [Leptospira interrogans str. 2003000735]|uniref:Uncharacterized protein n=5 Tax=Leptospira interrogans TaxID=173 RepID=Q8F7E2_LEPIN|nr:MULTISPECIES: hypothetical protein [Leptospira]EMF73075.1 hypothetical protein LEP1GSC148_1918 [Leptospira interrogans serovar Canicola str. LT1962]EMP04900.1 hypothetical protein LEP1GSC124_4918 [Leptospira interrogans serovar Pyrogenes str. 200701872]EMY02113.1 hypothetical protein LEP1GSC029_1175 [Leptospira interrogans str. 2002000626]EMY23700.1 hypothetical protein LEP1GSC115_0436 [Leptospira interrogans serovar Australis str. 200703203]AAN48202.1 hypothetical protein LA_1003 [Leptospi